MGCVTYSQIVRTVPCIINIKGGNNNMKIIVTSIFVQDQDKALEFYTEKLGFVKKEDVP
ncbi:VOC family protein, partial [Bacillus spizizenii]|nr:VOC family protein [Bacillus spizizenii]